MPPPWLKKPRGKRMDKTISNPSITKELIPITCNYLTIGYSIVAFHHPVCPFGLSPLQLNFWLLSQLPSQIPAATQEATSHLSSKACTKSIRAVNQSLKMLFSGKGHFSLPVPLSYNISFTDEHQRCPLKSIFLLWKNA